MVVRVLGQVHPSPTKVEVKNQELKTPGNSKTVEPILDISRVTEAIRRAQVLRSVVPRTTTQYVRRAVSKYPCRTICRCPFVIAIPTKLYNPNGGGTVVIRVEKDLSRQLYEKKLVRYELRYCSSLQRGCGYHQAMYCTLGRVTETRRTVPHLSDRHLCH